VGMKTVSAVPHSPVLEDAILPQTEDITRTLVELVEF
jgi:hypothetical protein